MLSDAINYAYGVLEQRRLQILADNHIDAATWEHAIETLQQSVYPIGSAGASQDMNYKALLKSMDDEHSAADQISGSSSLDILERLQIIEGWQKLLTQVSTSTMSVAQPFGLGTKSVLNRTDLQVRRTPSDGTTTTTTTTPTGLPQGTTTAMATGAGVGAAIVGLMAGLATGEVKYAVGGALLGAAVGAGAGYYAHNGIPSLK